MTSPIVLEMLAADRQRELTQKAADERLALSLASHPQPRHIWQQLVGITHSLAALSPIGARATPTAHTGSDERRSLPVANRVSLQGDTTPV